MKNFESSDGHGQGYDRYLTHGAVDGRQSFVVLLSIRREEHRHADGWERAVVVTYAELLADGPKSDGNRRLPCGFMRWSLGDSNP